MEAVSQKKEIPKFSTKLPGSFWGITTFFNPCNYKNKLENYKKFREASEKQGLNLICVELTFNDNNFQLTQDDADILIQKKTDSILWQKERLLNIGLKYLPSDCDKVAWLDADIIFLNNNWLSQSSKLLENYAVIQLYSFAARLPKGVFNLDFNELKEGKSEGQKFYGVAYGVANFGKKSLLNMNQGFTGFAWAARRDILDSTGLYDRLILGSADRLMAYSFYGHKCAEIEDMNYSERQMVNCDEWTEKIFEEVKGSIYYTEGEIFHLWHGSTKNRQSKQRKIILIKNDFDPDLDIKKDQNGCWVWNSKKPKLHQWARRYFWLRNEQGLFLSNIFLFFYNLKVKLAIIELAAMNSVNRLRDNAAARSKEIFEKTVAKIEKRRNLDSYFWKTSILIKDWIWRLIVSFNISFEPFNLERKQKIFRKAKKFIIVGAMRSGTTSLYEYLKKHPEIFRAAIKEPALFLDNDKVINFPCSQPRNDLLKISKIKRFCFKHNIIKKDSLDYQLLSPQKSLIDKKLVATMLVGYKGQRYIGEASTYYTKAPLQGMEVPKNIRKQFPEMKFIYILRNPIDRIISHYLWMMEKYTDQVEYEELNSILKRKREWFLDISLYHYQLSNYLKYFPKSRFKIVIFEEFIENPRNSLKEIFEFLGVDSAIGYPSEFEICNKTKNRENFSTDSLKLTKENYNKIITSIKNDVAQLEKFLGRSLTVWDLSKEKWCKN